MSFPGYPIASSLRGSSDTLYLWQQLLSHWKRMWIWALWNSLHLGSIFITQCVEDVLFICRRADSFPRARSRASMLQINWTYCISAVLWDCGLSFSAHQACCVDLQMLVLLWANCCLEITRKCSTLCSVERRRSLGKLVNLELRIFL